LEIDRLPGLRRQFKQFGIDGLLVTRSENREYLSRFTGSDGWLIISPDEAILAVDSRYVEQAKIEASGYEVVHIRGELQNWLPDIVSRLNINKLGFESRDISHALYDKLCNAIRNGTYSFDFIATVDIVESLRTIKDITEIGYIIRAAQLADSAMEYAESIITQGKTELYIAWELERFLRDQGSEAIPFEIIVASGPNSALPHHRPSTRIICEDDPVLIDMGARTKRYCSDISRTFCRDKSNSRFNEIYDIVLGAQLTAINTIAPGTTGHDADLFARTVIDTAGYSEYFGHGLGHGVGLNVHESPRLGPNSQDILEEGMVFTIEPGIYIPGWGGIRIEDTVMFKDGKIVSLNRMHK
jgi:Xaa-Pro aminopeptidase